MTRVQASSAARLVRALAHRAAPAIPANPRRMRGSPAWRSACFHCCTTPFQGANPSSGRCPMNLSRKLRSSRGMLRVVPDPPPPRKLAALEEPVPCLLRPKAGGATTGILHFTAAEQRHWLDEDARQDLCLM